MCRLNEYRPMMILPHMSHVYDSRGKIFFLSGKWVSRCLPRVDGSAKERSQMSHLYGLSPTQSFGKIFALPQNLYRLTCMRSHMSTNTRLGNEILRTDLTSEDPIFIMRRQMRFQISQFGENL